MVDKSLIIIIIFAGMFAISAGLLLTGAVPTVFQTNQVVNETSYETKNQTKLLVDFVTLYLDNQDEDAKKIAAALVTSNLVLQKQQLVVNKSIEAANLHQDLAKKTDIIINNINNLTKVTYDLLKQHAINATELGMEQKKSGNR